MHKIGRIIVPFYTILFNVTLLLGVYVKSHTINPFWTKSSLKFQHIRGKAKAHQILMKLMLKCMIVVQHGNKIKHYTAANKIGPLYIYIHLAYN